MADRLDIVIFGVTGFTGQHTVKIIQKLSKSKGRNLTWAVAGRNKVNIQELLKTLNEETGCDDFLKVQIIVADLADQKSILAMTGATKLVLNCCGPYRFMGETVVKACIATGTHQLDISGELVYMEDIQLKYDQKAREAGVYIISACGVECIINDLGVTTLQQKFEGTLHSVDSYLKFDYGNQNYGGCVNFGSWESMVYITADTGDLSTSQTKLFKTNLPKFEPVVEWKKLPFKPEVVSDWAVICPTADRSVTRRSQSYLFEEKKIRPVQVQTYFLVESFWTIILLGIFSTFVVVLSKFNFGRNLLLKYPKIFSGGFVGNEEPSKDVTKNIGFTIILHGKGWKEKLTDPLDKYTYPSNKNMVLKVEGKDPAYGATATCLVLAGIKLLTEPEKLPSRGGVYAPGATFAGTSLAEELNENGVTFKIVSESDF